MYIKTAVTGGTFFFIVTTILISLSSVVSAQEGSSALSAKGRFSFILLSYVSAYFLFTFPP
ncbi:hypothetical protein [Cloacibacillus evryensis]|uniref:hypothetical protein n=1 Tax=Cloacibacillus evryensis TaxID=508460 RepID=UPI0022E4D192|nr:hypothetical protein [Cloacibacillus evryensis]